MKRILTTMALIAALSAPAFAQLRLDIGVDIPRGLGSVASGGFNVSSATADALDRYIFPFPEAALYYQTGLGPLHVGGGVRGFTLILETVLWPNVFAELQLGPVVFEGQIGGLVFGAFGLGNSLQAGKVLIPDLSVWLKLGKAFRIGGGGMGFILPDLNKTIVFVYYLGAKVALDI